MLNGRFRGARCGSGAIIWKARELQATGEISEDAFFDMVASSAPSVGYCNTMGTAATMNSLAEVLGMQLPGSASIPAPYRERGQISFETGKRVVELVRDDVRPNHIMTRQAFENAVVVNSALGGSTNAPIHLNAIARHLGVPLDNDDWQRLGHMVPLLMRLQPAGTYLGEDFHHAGGVPSVITELLAANLLPHPDAVTANGKTIAENCAGRGTTEVDVIRPVSNTVVANAGFINFKGNLFDSAIMKTSVISSEFRDRYLSNPDDPDAFEARAIVFDGPEDFHLRIDDESLKIDVNSILIMRGAGPVGYPGGAEVVNMRAPSYLLKQGVHSLPCLGDGRQSGTSGSPSILNASPEAAQGGGLALVKTGDMIRVDLKTCKVDALVDQAELEARRKSQGKQPFAPESQTPWQEIFRSWVQPFSEGMTLKGACQYQDIAKKFTPRDNH